MSRFIFATAILFSLLSKSFAQSEEALRPSQQTAIVDVDSRSDELKAVNQAIWKFAEVGLEEHQSASLLVSKLTENGFEVKRGVSDMPTAFVASYGSGKPIIGILAEYDALPGMSQKVKPERLPFQEGAAGHACGHSGLGTGALGAALAVKASMEKHNLKGTIRLYGTPAEETVIGKVYMLLDGQFDDLDVCLHWHPSTKTGAWAGSSKALISAKFTFDGVSAHAAGNPEKGRSALDAVELMNVGVNFMREHTKEDARLHYVITNGGGAPNVVPSTATVWYFVRADKHEDVEYYFKWVRDIAEGAEKMTRTKLSVQIDTDCHELIQNTPLSELLHENLAPSRDGFSSHWSMNLARRSRKRSLARSRLSKSLSSRAKARPTSETFRGTFRPAEFAQRAWPRKAPDTVGRTLPASGQRLAKKASTTRPEFSPSARLIFSKSPNWCWPRKPTGSSEWPIGNTPR